jgi:hypothetical protein
MSPLIYIAQPAKNSQVAPWKTFGDADAALGFAEESVREFKVAYCVWLINKVTVTLVRLLEPDAGV